MGVRKKSPDKLVYIDIDHDVPITKPKRKERTSNYPMAYPLGKMMIGDSFMVYSGSEDKTRTMIKVINRTWRFRQKWRSKFVCRKVDHGVRCWRVE